MRRGAGMKFQIIPRLLHFKQPAGTSRGVYTTRRVWYVVLTDPATDRIGVGECAPLPALSRDDLPNYAAILQLACEKITAKGRIDPDDLLDYPSMRFGLETALLHLKRGSPRLFDTSFSQGREGIPINGLIWMGRADEMLARIQEKLRIGFRCLKVKIGAIDFDQELALLAFIRKNFSSKQIELRVDANGAFTPEDAPKRLQQLARFDLHSIEQPIRAGQWKAMGKLREATPLPIALDEELIGVNERAKKIELLDAIHPAYLVLKPSLHGGMSGSEEWIGLAEEREIGWWATSALESNVGLNAIAHWCAHLRPALPQGLGTGLLFTDNIDFPLSIRRDRIWFDPTSPKPDLKKEFIQ